jgi:hypothetical protein
MSISGLAARRRLLSAVVNFARTPAGEQECFETTVHALAPRSFRPTCPLRSSGAGAEEGFVSGAALTAL